MFHVTCVQLTTIAEPEPPSSPDPQLAPTSFVYKTEAELEEQILKQISQNRQKIREKRATDARKKPQDNDCENISPQMRAMLEKDSEMQKNIGSKEEKLHKLVEKQLEKAATLSQKEKQLQEMRERTQRMLEKSRKKNLEFEAEEERLKQAIETKETKTIKKTSMKEKLITKASDKAKSMNEKAKNMKEEMRKKRSEAKKDDDDDLLAFLRKSHKEKGNIYELVDSEFKAPQNMTNKLSLTDKPDDLNRTNEIPENCHPNILSTPSVDKNHEEPADPDQSHPLAGPGGVAPCQPSTTPSLVQNQGQLLHGTPGSKAEKRRSILDHLLPAFTKTKPSLPDPPNPEIEEAIPAEIAPKTNSPSVGREGLPLSCSRLALMGELPESLMDLALTAELLEEEPTENTVKQLEADHLKDKGNSLHDMRQKTQKMLEKARQKQLEFEEQSDKLKQAFEMEEKVQETPIRNSPVPKSGMSDLAKEMKEEMRRKREERLGLEVQGETVIEHEKSSTQNEHLNEVEAQNAAVILAEPPKELFHAADIGVRTGPTKLLRKKSLSENNLVPKLKFAQGFKSGLTASQSLLHEGTSNIAPVRNQEARNKDELLLEETIQINGKHWQVRTLKLCKI